MTDEILSHFDDPTKCSAAFAHLSLQDLLGKLDDDQRLVNALRMAFSDPNPLGGTKKIGSVAELASMPDAEILIHRNIGPLGITRIDQALHKLVAC